MDLHLKGKTAIVTGGSRGIGKASARELACEGVDVAIVARDMATLDASAKELAKESGRRVVPISCDTTNDDAVKAMVKEVAGAFGHIDILVNSGAKPGGHFRGIKLADITEDKLHVEMGDKVMGYLRCAREVAPYMAQQKWGRIINISGYGARRTGSTLHTIRNVSGVAITKNLAEELWPQGINVSVIHPGATRTEWLDQVIADRARQWGVSIEETERRMAQGNSVKRIIDARDIGYLVAMLASPRSIAINGDVIAAGGGLGEYIYY